MSRIGEVIRKHCLSYPETAESFPWGESAFKVKGKTFVFMRDDEKGVNFSVKLAASRAKALKMPGSEPTHYGMGAKGWVTIQPTSKTAAGVIKELIDESYRSVAPKRVLAMLDAK
jgi:predicted DNA-binding protein (MmcQ/YjbR family)